MFVKVEVDLEEETEYLMVKYYIIWIIESEGPFCGF